MQLDAPRFRTNGALGAGLQSNPETERAASLPTMETVTYTHAGAYMEGCETRLLISENAVCSMQSLVIANACLFPDPSDLAPCDKPNYVDGSVRKPHWGDLKSPAREETRDAKAGERKRTASSEARRIVQHISPR